MGLGAFALLGTLFILTQFLQFDLGYSALEAGVRMLPIAATLAVVSPVSSLLTRAVGMKLTTAGGLLLAAVGLWLVSDATVHSTYVNLLPGMIVIGAGAALVMPTASGSVMSSVPRGDAGVGAASNGTFTQFGAAMGVAVLGSLLSTRYQDTMTTVLAPYHVPPALNQTILGSVGGALDVAAHAGGTLGHVLAAAARGAFIDGAGLALTVASAVALGGCIVAAAFLPKRPTPVDDPTSSTGRVSRRAAARARS